MAPTKPLSSARTYLVVVLVDAMLEGDATDRAALRHVRLHIVLHSAALGETKGGEKCVKEVFSCLCMA